MLFEIRKISFHTVQEFGQEYLMIAVGILAALGLEHLVTHHLRIRAAEQARQKGIEQLADTLKRDIRAGKSRATLGREGWDVAVANQSAADIASAVPRRFSAAHAAKRNSSALGAQGSLFILDAPGVLDAMADVDLPRADPVETLKALRNIARGNPDPHPGQGGTRDLDRGIPPEPPAPPARPMDACASAGGGWAWSSTWSSRP